MNAVPSLNTASPLPSSSQLFRTTEATEPGNNRFTFRWAMPGSVLCEYECQPGVASPLRHLHTRPDHTRGPVGPGHRTPEGNPSLQFDPEIAHGFRRAARRRSAKALIPPPRVLSGGEPGPRRVTTEQAAPGGPPVDAGEDSHEQPLLRTVPLERTPLLAATWDAYYAALHRDILNTGWSTVVQNVQAGDPPETTEWVYTIGLHHGGATPDLIVTGLPTTLALEIVGLLATAVHTGRLRFPREANTVARLPVGLNVLLRPVHESWETSHTGLADGYLKRRHGLIRRPGPEAPLRVPSYVQILLPGPDGDFSALHPEGRHYPALPMHQRRP